MASEEKVPAWHPASRQWLEDFAKHPVREYLLILPVGFLLSFLFPAPAVIFLLDLDWAVEQERNAEIVIWVLTAMLMAAWFQLSKLSERSRTYLAAVPDERE